MADNTGNSAFNLDNVNGALLLDRSPSMNEKLPGTTFTRWSAGTESLIPVAKELAKRDDDGITIGVFDTSFDIKDNVTIDKIDGLLRGWRPNGSGTCLAGPLAKLVDMFFPKQYEDKVETYTETETVKVKNPNAGKSTGGLWGLLGSKEPEFIEQQRQVTKTRTVRGGAYKKVSPVKQVVIVVYTDGEAQDADATAAVLVDASKRINTRRDLGVLFIQVGDDASATAFLERLNDRLKPEGADHDIVAVVKLEDVEDYTPEKLLELPFTA